MAILDFKDSSGLLDSIVGAVVHGYREDLILDELATLVENKKIEQKEFETAVDALRLFANRLSASLNILADSMSQFEFNEPVESVIKNRPLTLAQQAMRDVSGFKSALEEHGEEPTTQSKEHQSLNAVNDDVNWPESSVEME